MDYSFLHKGITETLISSIPKYLLTYPNGSGDKKSNTLPKYDWGIVCFIGYQPPDADEIC